MEVVEFSTNSEHLAISGADGHLRVWETATSKLWHEFIPSSHLAATCSCLSWAPTHVETAQVTAYSPELAKHRAKLHLYVEDSIDERVFRWGRRRNGSM